MNVIGGAGVATPLTLRSTSGVGTTGADIILQGGNNGATEIARFFNSGNVSIGSATEGSRLHVHISNSSTAGAGPTLEQHSSGDIILQFLLTSTRAWVIGIDNSDSDKFKIHSGNSGFADRMMEIDVNGNAVVKVFHMCWPLSDGSSKFIPIDEEPNHQIVHAFRLGKAQRATN